MAENKENKVKDLSKDYEYAWDKYSKAELKRYLHFLMDIKILCPNAKLKGNV